MPSVRSTSNLFATASPFPSSGFSTITTPAGSIVPITTTITSASSTCVATLQGQLLNDGATALIYKANGDFMTLNSTCFASTNTARLNATGNVTTLPIASVSSGAFGRLHRSKLSPGMIAGLVFAIIAVLLALVGAGAWMLYRRRKSRMEVIDMPSKTIDEDASGEISPRWEKDSASIKEMSALSAPSDKSFDEDASLGTSLRWEKDGAEIKEMSAGPVPVEIGDARSVTKESLSTSGLDYEAVSPAFTSRSDEFAGAGLEGIVSPLTPQPQYQWLGWR